MKKLSLIFSMLIFNLIQLDAQCSGTVVECNTGPVNFSGSMASQCINSSNCDNLESEYLIVSTVDTVILGSTPTISFDPTLYAEQCISVQPVCYDIAMFKGFVDELNSMFGFCCPAVNAETVEPACEAITSVYSSGADINDLTEVLVILRAFRTDALTVQGFAAVIDKINTSGISSACNDIMIAYCLDTDVDFTINAYDVCPANECLPVDNRSGTEVSGIYKAGIINSTAIVPAGNNVIYQGETEVNCDPDFETVLGAEFLGEIMPCIPAPQPKKAPQKK